MTLLRLLLLAIVLTLGAASTAAVADPLVPPTSEAREAFKTLLRDTRVGIVTGGPGGTYLQLGTDVSNLVRGERGDTLRVTVMVGRGSLGNLQDLVFLENTDLALVQADVLDFIRRTEPEDYNFLSKRLQYVARFHPEVIHVLGRGLEGGDLRALDGKVVSVGGQGGGSQITAEIVFEELLGIRPIFRNLSEREALADLASEMPTLDAMLYVSGRGSSLFTNLGADIAAGLQRNNVFFVPAPATLSEGRSYRVDWLSGDDYPALIAPEAPVRVWTVPAVLAVYAWPTNHERYKRLSDFINVFFDARAKLSPKRGSNNNWCYVDLRADIAGWTRFGPAEAWLELNRSADTRVCGDDTVRPAPGPATDSSCPSVFAAAMRASGLDPEQQQVKSLLEQWKRANPQACQ